MVYSRIFRTIRNKFSIFNFQFSIKKGFTLAEIMVVISLVAILAIVALTQYKTQIAKAFDKQRKDHLYRIKVALEEYYADNNCYPESLPGCDQLFPGGYLPKMPCDPQSKKPYEYVYDGNDCPQWFKVYTLLDNTADPKITDVGCAAGCGTDNAYNYGVSSTNTTVGSGATPTPAPTTAPTAAPTASPAPTPTPSPAPTPAEGYCNCGGGCFACTGIGVCERIALYGEKNCWSPNFCSSTCNYGTCEEVAYYSCGE